jgi:hypothetical protein
MCTDKQHDEKIELLKKIDGRPPIDDHIVVSSVRPWYVDYRERKHIFIWLPTTQTLSFEEFGSGTVQAQIWINIGMPAGIKMLAPNVTSGTIDVMIRCCDEELP